MQTYVDPSAHNVATNRLEPQDIASGCGAIVISAIIAVALHQNRVALPSNTLQADDIAGHHTSMVSYGLLFWVLLVVFLSQPLLGAAFATLGKKWDVKYAPAGVILICSYISIFIVHEGRHQFGGFDFGIVIDTGWRLLQGQRLYSDFIGPTPPGFSLGIKYAYQLFGLSWNANLYLSAIFASGTMIWIYWLLRRLGLQILPALGIAFAVEAETMLLLSFWWYNNTALVMAAVFLLACLLFLRQPTSRGVQLSFVCSLATLAIMKPNVAGVAIACSIALLLTTYRRPRQLLLLLACAVLLVWLVLIVNHIGLRVMLEAYREANSNRGGFSAFGFQQMGPVDRSLAIGITAALFISSFWQIAKGGQSLGKSKLNALSLSLFLFTALLTSGYAIRTNGEFWLVELPPLFVVGAYLCYGPSQKSALASRFFTSVVCACVAVGLFLGIVRFRVFTIGPRQFYQWTDNENQINEGFLKDVRVGAPMIKMEQEIGTAVHSNPGPYFFGPRIDFNYAVQHLQSPDHLPAWWHPGVSFSSQRIPELLHKWESHKFETLIFLKSDYTFYPRTFIDLIGRDYVRDDHFSTITVYRRRSAQ